jgi:SMC interacting uncharacterized protein involved in chromosome segregation
MKKLIETWVAWSPMIAGLIVGYFLYWKKFMEENSVGKTKIAEQEKEITALRKINSELELEMKKMRVDVDNFKTCKEDIIALKKDIDHNWRITTELTYATENLKNAFEHKISI